MTLWARMSTGVLLGASRLHCGAEVRREKGQAPGLAGNSENSEFELGLLSHCEIILVKVGGQN